MGTILAKELVDGKLAQELEQKLAVIKNLTATKKDVEKQLSEFKSELQLMIGGASYEGEVGKITFVPGAEESLTIDVKALSEQEPELFLELSNDYPKKVSGRAPSYRYTFK